MSDNKKYYYLKLKENFFESEEIKLLESIENGYLYSNILLKMFLKSLKTEGRLMFRENIPYNPKMLATITGHNLDVVEKAIKVFINFGLVRILDSGAIYILDIQNFIGQSSSEADRIRKYREKIEEEKKLEISMDVQNPYICTPEIEIERELELEKEIEKERKSLSSSDDDLNKVSSKSDSLHVPYDGIVSLFNEMLGEEMPKVEIISETRKSLMKQRTKDKLHTLNDWEWYFNKIKNSDWLMGRAVGVNGKPFRCSFDWITNSSNFIKITEGNYDGVVTATPKPSTKPETFADEVNRTNWAAYAEEQYKQAEARRLKDEGK
ncbi:MAG: phage replisome organizer N-terminal domain-containing protein [Bacilli bacterium]|jgi:predicted phage replisome organizer